MATTGTGRRPDYGMFLGGVVLGLLLAALVVWRAMAGLQEHGVVVEIDTEQIAAQVRDQVRQAARAELPTRLEAMRQAVPQQVAQEAGRRVRAMSLDLGGFKVPMPPVAADQIQAGLEDALRAGMGVALRNADVDAIAGKLGDQAYDLVKVRLAQGLNGQRFTVRPWPWFSLPVTLVTQ